MKIYKGVYYILISAFCFALMNVFVKLSGDLPSMQKSFFRNLVSCIFAIILLVKAKEGFTCKRSDLPLLLLRSTLGTLGILGNYYAVDHLLLADASMLNKLSPFFGIIFSAIFLKEKATGVQKLGVLLAFIGSLFIIKPGFQYDTIIPALAGFLGGMCAGGAYTCVRGLGKRKVPGAYIVFFFSAFSCLFTLPNLLLNYHAMTLMQLGCLLMAGLAAAGGQFSITAAYRHAPAKEISVFDYSQVIFSALLGFVLFQQLPDGFSVLGYVIIIVTAVYMFFYNKRIRTE